MIYYDGKIYLHEFSKKMNLALSVSQTHPYRKKSLNGIVAEHAIAQIKDWKYVTSDSVC
jgi:hypothetical protein